MSYGYGQTEESGSGLKRELTPGMLAGIVGALVAAIAIATMAVMMRNAQKQAQLMAEFAANVRRENGGGGTEVPGGTFQQEQLPGSGPNAIPTPPPNLSEQEKADWTLAHNEERLTQQRNAEGFR